MPPERGHGTFGAEVSPAAETRARWSEIAALYERFAGCVSAAAWTEAATLLARADLLVRAVAPLDAGRRSARTPAEAAEWAEIETLACAVVRQHARVLASAETARDGAAAALARSRAGRNDAARYRRPIASEAFFTSRTV